MHTTHHIMHKLTALQLVESYSVSVCHNTYPLVFSEKPCFTVNYYNANTSRPMLPSFIIWTWQP